MSVSRRSCRWGLAFTSVVLSASVGSVANGQEACFTRLDNGIDMTGWRKSTTNPHGPGDGWAVEDGAFVGRQTAGERGGILMTDASYRDVEVVFEVKVDWGCDSGFFFRTAEGARAYQVTIDHLEASGVGTIWGEGFSPELREIPYFLTDQGNAAILAPDRHQEPIFDLAQWSSLWDPTDFNEVRARVEGNPPRIQVWISETLVTDFTDGMTRSEVGTSGPLAIQVHSGSRWITDGTAAFKNIRVRDLAVPCDGAGGGGGGGSGGSGGNGGGGGQATGGQAIGGQGFGGGAGVGMGGSAGSGVGGRSAEAGGSAGDPMVGGGGASGGAPAAGGQLSGTGGADAGNGGMSGTTTTSSGGAGRSGGGSGSPAATGASDSGCGCRVATRHGNAPAVLLLLLGAGAHFVRRRR